MVEWKRLGLWQQKSHFAFQVVLKVLEVVVKYLLANVEDMRDSGSIPGLGRSPGGGMAIHYSILAWRIPWCSLVGYSP